VVSGVRRGMGVLDGGVGDHRRGIKEQFWGEFGASHCNRWGLCCAIVQERSALPKLLWGELVYVRFNSKLEIISTLLRQIGIPLPTVAPCREALYKDRQSNRRVGVF